jgi:hypothetical protein
MNEVITVSYVGTPSVWLGYVGVGQGSIINKGDLHCRVM